MPWINSLKILDLMKPSVSWPLALHVWPTVTWGLLPVPSPTCFLFLILAISFPFSLKRVLLSRTNSSPSSFLPASRSVVWENSGFGRLKLLLASQVNQRNKTGPGGPWTPSSPKLEAATVSPVLCPETMTQCCISSDPARECRNPDINANCSTFTFWQYSFFPPNNL